MENKNIKIDQEEISHEKLAQMALGNTTVEIDSKESDNDLLSVPKTSGTGSNNESNADSVIVHDDKKGEDRYKKDGD